MVITVCIGSSCHLKGSRMVVEALQKLIDEAGLNDRVQMKGQFCMGDCLHGVNVTVDGEKYSVTPDGVGDFFRDAVQKRLETA